MSEPVWTLVDSNVWLDVFGAPSPWKEWSEHALELVYDEGPVCINPLIYAEISVRFDAVEELEARMPPHQVIRDQVPYEAAFLAGKAFALYQSRGGLKRAPLCDHYIGAHAAVRGYRLLTRDKKARFRTYFPKLEVIAPD